MRGNKRKNPKPHPLWKGRCSSSLLSSLDKRQTRAAAINLQPHTVPFPSHGLLPCTRRSLPSQPKQIHQKPHFLQLCISSPWTNNPTDPRPLPSWTSRKLAKTKKRAESLAPHSPLLLAVSASSCPSPTEPGLPSIQPPAAAQTRQKHSRQELLGHSAGHLKQRRRGNKKKKNRSVKREADLKRGQEGKPIWRQKENENRLACCVFGFLQVTELLTADRKVKRGRSNYGSPPLSGFRGGAWTHAQPLFLHFQKSSSAIPYQKP